jgi:hypothetical protein
MLLAFAEDSAGFVAIRQPLLATLVSESRATWPFRAGSGRTSPGMCAGATGGPSSSVVSINDIDVRSLKNLYSANTNSNSNGTSPSPYPGPGTPRDRHQLTERAHSASRHSRCIACAGAHRGRMSADGEAYTVRTGA